MRPVWDAPVRSGGYHALRLPPNAARFPGQCGGRTCRIGPIGLRHRPANLAQSARRTASSPARQRSPSRMLRLLHTADVHLGARHTDMGERAAVLRERQFAAFRATVDLAIAEAVDLVLIAGDLFDSNTQPRRSVERVAAELARLAKACIRTVMIPGTHDVYDGASIYRSYDLAAMAGPRPRMDRRPDARAAEHLAAVARRGRLRPSLRDQARPAQPAGRPRRPHGPPAPPGASAWSTARWPSPAGRTRTRSSSPTRRSRDTGLDYLALGHWHSALEGRAGGRRLRVLGRARAGGGGPGRRRPGPARHPRRRAAADDDVTDRGPQGRSDPPVSGSSLTRAGSPRQPDLVAPRAATPTRTWSSTSG